MIRHARLLLPGRGKKAGKKKAGLKNSNLAAAYEMLRTYASEQPLQMAIVLVAFVVSSVLESASFITILPILSVAQGDSAKLDGIGAKVSEFIAQMGIPPTLPGLLMFLAAATLLKALVRIAADAYLVNSIAGLVAEMRLRLLRALGNVGWDYVVSHSPGQLATLYSTESQRAATGMNQSVQLISNVIQACLFMGTALTISWEFTWAIIVGSLLVSAPLHFLVGFGRRMGRRLTKTMSAMIHNLIEGVAGFKALKAMARENSLVALLTGDIQNYRKAWVYNSYSTIALAHLPEACAVVVFCGAIYWFLTVAYVPFNEILVIAALGYKGIGKINNLQRILQRAMTSYQGFQAVRMATDKAEAMKEVWNGSQPVRFEEAVVFDRVSFAYGPEKPVLNEISMRLPARGVTAIIGASGAGKSTLVDVMLGLRAPASGNITIDSVEIREIDIRSWRSMIGYVPQEIHLFDKSIFENVALGDETVTREKVRKALDDAGAGAWIGSLPDGIYTRAGSGGLMFSGGQRQRIALARALVHEPKLLLLDEATSALDPESQALICDTLEKLADSVSILMITHQPGVLRIADHVYRIEDGLVRLSDKDTVLEIPKSRQVI